MDFREALLAEMQKSKNKLVESKSIKKESKVEEDTEEYLEPRFDSRASFYKKAKVVKKDNGDEELYSYGTHVGGMKDGKPYSKGKWSQTTSRHQKEYFTQKGYDVKDVPVEEGKKITERLNGIDGVKQVIEDRVIPDLRLVVELLDGMDDNPKYEGYSECVEDCISNLAHGLAEITDYLEEGCGKKKEEILDIQPNVNIDMQDSNLASGNTTTTTLDIPIPFIGG